MTTLDGFGEPGPLAEELSRERLLTFFGAAVAISIALGFVPYGGWVIYPFRLFATWAHEMGHGIGALVVGADFRELEIYQTLGGQALIAGADGSGQVLVSALGLIGSAVLGAIVMVAGSRASTAPYVLAALSAVITLATLVWTRNLFGFVAMLVIAAALGLAARFLPPVGRVILTQFLAVQLALAAWSSRDYLFTQGFERDGRRFDSDTQNIADEWFLPYWFWGGLLGGLSVVILVGAFWAAWLRPQSGEAEGSLL